MDKICGMDTENLLNPVLAIIMIAVLVIVALSIIQTIHSIYNPSFKEISKCCEDNNGFMSHDKQYCILQKGNEYSKYTIEFQKGVCRLVK